MAVVSLSRDEAIAVNVTGLVVGGVLPRRTGAVLRDGMCGSLVTGVSGHMEGPILFQYCLSRY